MKTQLDISKLLEFGKIQNELDFERALIADRKLRVLSKEDSKYKVIYTKEEASETDRKKSGVSISDVYQMLAYTVKLNVNICYLIYPDTIGVKNKLGTYYEIKHHEDSGVSKIFYHRLPTLIENEHGELTEIIEAKELELYNHLKKDIICA